MSSLERIGESAALAHVAGRVAERSVAKITPVVALPEPLETIDLSEVRTRPIDWLWRGYIPLRKLTILDGDPGLGKSTILLDLASRGSIGGLAPTGEPLGDAFTTIYITVEDDAILLHQLVNDGEGRHAPLGPAEVKAGVMSAPFSLPIGLEPKALHEVRGLGSADDLQARFRHRDEGLIPRNRIGQSQGLEGGNAEQPPRAPDRAQVVQVVDLLEGLFLAAVQTSEPPSFGNLSAMVRMVHVA